MDGTTEMKLRSGNTMPLLGFGTWKLKRDTAEAVASALHIGYRMIDTSGDYGTQPGIADGIARSGLGRADFYISTKIEETDDPREATLKNLDELGTDYADLMLIHRPPEQGAGEDLWEGLIRVKEEGLARDIGVSNYSQDRIDRLIAATGEVPAVNQIEWSPFGHSDTMQAYAEGKNILLQAYAPLTRTTRLDDENLAAFAERYGKTPAQILLRWNIQRGTVPLPKANTKSHREENIGALEFELAREDMERLNALNERYSSLGTLPYE